MRTTILVSCLILGPLARPPESVPAESPSSADRDVGKRLVRPDLVLHYRDDGHGEPVLLLAGGPGVWGGYLTPLAQIVARRARAIVPDARGTGGSIPSDAAAITLEATIADLEALRVELGLSQWTVLGHSWGGMLGLEYASRHPGSLKGLVLVASGGASFASFYQAFQDNVTCRMSRDDRAALAYWTQPEVVAQDPIRAAMEAIRATGPSAFYDRTRAAEYLAPFTPGREHYNPEANELLSRAYDQGATARIEALRRMRLPTLIIHGRQDPMPESVAIENHALLNGSRLVWLDRCGHVPWMERPKALESALFEFLLQQRP